MQMHSDEVRSSAELLRQRADELLSDPESLVRKYEGLAAREARYRKQIAQLEAQLKKSKSELAKAQKQARGAQAAAKTEKSEHAETTQALGTARAALDAYRAENKQLKDDLRRVRGSRSMKLGRALLSPAQIFRGTGGVQAEPADETAPPADAATRAESLSAQSEPKTPPAPATPEEAVAEKERLFAEDPCAQTLSRLISYQWYSLGMIERPAELLIDNPGLRADLGPKGAVLANRILGAHRALSAADLIPDRSRGAAYTVERGRVMYCAHSTPIFNSNGYSTRTRGIAAGLSAAGVDVKVVARAGYPWDTKTDRPAPARARHEAVLDGVDYVHLPGADLGSDPIDRYIIQAADAVVREAKLLRPEIIHSASNFRTALPALIAARRLGVPFVYEVRGLWEVTEASKKPGWERSERYRAMEMLETLVAAEADSVLAITQEVADELIRRGVDGDKIRLAGNSVDAHDFLPLPRDTEFADRKKIRTDVPVIGFAGSIVDYEGLDTLLEAAEILSDRGVDHQVVIAGSGADAERLQRIRSERRLRTVLFTGRLPLTDMPRLISTFDIMPCPRHSLPVTEMVSPIKPLEAFSSGKAVILSDVSPHRTLAGDGSERALLFPAGDAEALADVIERLIEDPELREELGRRARRWVRTERSWRGLGRSLTEWYRDAAVRSLSCTDPAPVPMKTLRVGVIADEFTTKTLSGSVTATPIDRTRWRTQLDEESFDAVFVESAWAGNGGQWHRGVGHYGEEENRDLYSLLRVCEQRGIPTIFWNKEDPVHFNRFRLTAARCTHVFTTDADKISDYLATEWASTRTAAAVPFYAQPQVHNPLPSRFLFDSSVAYAGTYYGDRYRERSAQLARLLTTAKPYGLAVYDRQLAYPNSPYRFPREFAEDIRGVLPYDTVIDSYKSHLAHLNVNSVTQSPSMFSRRVVEIAASGGLVLSGPGRGITETFGDAIPATNDTRNWRALLHSWATDPVARVRESWLQYRAVMRSHTVDTELTIMFRTAGITVTGVQTPSYAVVADGCDGELLTSLAHQSVLPAEVFVPDTAAAKEVLSSAGVIVRPLSEIPSTGADWIGVLTAPVARTHFEDLLLAERFGSWNRIAVREAAKSDEGSTIAREVFAIPDERGLARTSSLDLSKGLVEQLTAKGEKALEWLIPPTAAVHDAVSPSAAAEAVDRPKTVVVAGHDLKFAGAIIDGLQAAGHRVLVDQWASHSQHDEDESRRLLDEADVIFCEWGLGNAVWYSKHKRPGQRLVVRVHAQEIRGPHLRRVTHVNVNQYIFVGELIMRAAIASHGVPAQKSEVVPNVVDVGGLDLPKLPGSEKNIGLVGIVPQSKRVDRALDILERLLARDGDYRLFIKGKQPGDYPWMKNRPAELEYYDTQYARIEQINAAHPGAVVFDGYSEGDMAEWYRKIGIALSVSDHESFHFTIPDGAASGALPCCLAWPGSDALYPDEWIFDSLDDIVDAISDPEAAAGRDDKSYARARYDSSTSVSALVEEIVG